MTPSADAKHIAHIIVSEHEYFGTTVRELIGKKQFDIANCLEENIATQLDHFRNTREASGTTRKVPSTGMRDDAALAASVGIQSAPQFSSADAEKIDRLTRELASERDNGAQLKEIADQEQVRADDNWNACQRAKARAEAAEQEQGVSMRMIEDREGNVVYISNGAPAIHSVESSPGIVLRYDADGALVGVTITDARARSAEGRK